MSIADNKRGVIVGIFIFIAIVIFVAGVLTLGGQQKRFVSSVRVSAVFDDVEGLRPGNNIWFSGVKVGTVKEMKFYGNSQIEVFLNIDEEAQKYIHKDAKAKLSTESLIGNMIVELTGGSPNAPIIEEGDKLAVEAGLSTEDIMKTLQENNENLITITNNFKTLSAGLVDGKGTVGALLTDSTLAQDFRGIVNGLQQTSANTVGASRELSAFTSKLNQKGGLVDELLTDTAVFNRLQQAMLQLEQATADASEMTKNLQEATEKLQSDNNALGVLLNDPEFANNLKTTMQNLDAGTKKFDENMEALQSNFLLRGFFKKRDKEQN